LDKFEVVEEDETDDQRKERFFLLTTDVIEMLNLKEKLIADIKERLEGKDHLNEMMNQVVYELNMIMYLLDPITVAEASIAHLTGLKNKSTLEAVALIRSRVNFFNIYNMCDTMTTTNMQMKATQKLCFDRHAVRLQVIERKLQEMVVA